MGAFTFDLIPAGAAELEALSGTLLLFSLPPLPKNPIITTTVAEFKS